MTKLLRYSLSIFLLVIVFSFSIKTEKHADLKKWGYSWEEYDSSLFYRLQSVKDVVSYTDSALGAGTRSTHAYSELLASTLRKRFYHGYSYYSLHDNWLAWLAGNLIWDHLHAIVLPDDILKYPNAACSQQAIVLKACFRAAGIEYREVDLNGHFVLEGRVEGQWLLFDTNMEPRFPHGRKALDNLIQSGDLAASYRHVLSPARVHDMFAHPVYGPSNAPFAPNATLFQQATEDLSFVLPLMLPAVLLVYVFAIRRGRRIKAPDEVRFVEVEECVEELNIEREASSRKL